MSDLSDIAVHVKFKLSALWATTMFCYVYGDLFGFFRQQTVREILAGRAGPIGTHGGLLGAAISVVIPSAMVILSLVLAPRIGRALNVALGAAYSLIILITLLGTWEYYVFLSLVEVGLTLTIVWSAWRWPETSRA